MDKPKQRETESPVLKKKKKKKKERNNLQTSVEKKILMIPAPGRGGMDTDAWSWDLC